jgi:hypothetical protein
MPNERGPEDDALQLEPELAQPPSPEGEVIAERTRPLDLVAELSVENAIRLRGQLGAYVVIPRKKGTSAPQRNLTERVSAQFGDDPTRRLRSNWVPSFSDTMLALGGKFSDQLEGLWLDAKVSRRKSQEEGPPRIFGIPLDSASVGPRTEQAEAFIQNEVPQNALDRFTWVRNDDDIQLARAQIANARSQLKREQIGGEVLPGWGIASFFADSVMPDTLADFALTGGTLAIAKKGLQMAARTVCRGIASEKLGMALANFPGVYGPAIESPIAKTLASTTAYGAGFGAYGTARHAELSEVAGVPVEDLGQNVVMGAMIGAAMGLGFGAINIGLTKGKLAVRQSALPERVVPTAEEVARKAEITKQAVQELESPHGTYWMIGEEIHDPAVAATSGESGLVRITPEGQRLTVPVEDQTWLKKLRKGIYHFAMPMLSVLESAIDPLSMVGKHILPHNFEKFRNDSITPLAHEIEFALNKAANANMSATREAMAKSLETGEFPDEATFMRAQVAAMHGADPLEGKPVFNRLIAENKQRSRAIDVRAANAGLYEGSVDYTDHFTAVENVEQVLGVLRAHNPGTAETTLAARAEEIVHHATLLGSSGGALVNLPERASIPVTEQAARRQRRLREIIEKEYMKPQAMLLREPVFFKGNLDNVQDPAAFASWRNARIETAHENLRLLPHQGENMLRQAKAWIKDGVKSFPTLRNAKEYFHVRWNADAIAANEAGARQAFIQEALRNSYEYQNARDEATRRNISLRIERNVDSHMNRMWQASKENRGIFGEVHLGGKRFHEPSAIEQRAVAADPVALSEWLSPDVARIELANQRQVLFETLFRERAIAQGWDKEYGITNSTEMGEYIAEYADSLQRSGVITRKEAQRAKDDYRYMRDSFGGYRPPETGSVAVNNMLRAVSTLNYMTRCGQMALSLIVDLAHSAFRGPLGILEHCARWGKECFGMAGDWGLTPTELRLCGIGLAIEHNHSRSVAALHESGVTPKLDRMANKFTKLTGIEWLENRRSRMVARAVSREVAECAVHNRQKEYTNPMHEVHLESDMRARIREEIETHGDMSIDNFRTGLEHWTDEVAANKFMSEVKRLHNLEVILPGPMQQPTFFRSNYGRFFYSFYSYTNSLTTNLLGPLLANGQYGELASMVVHGYGLALAKSWLVAAAAGKPLEWDDPKLYERALHETPTGTFGYVLNPMFNVLAAAASGELRMISGKNALYNVVGNGPVRYGLDVLDALKAGGSAISKGVTGKGEDITQSELTNMMKVIPLQNWIVINGFKQAAIEKLGKPSPKQRKIAREKELKKLAELLGGAS